jgi:hypothetical protein
MEVEFGRGNLEVGMRKLEKIKYDNFLLQLD